MPKNQRVLFQDVSKTMYLLPRDGRLLRGMLINLWKIHWPLEYRKILKNISFQVKEGQGFGVIGENGAGKTSVLRLAGGVMNPSSGNVLVSGRTAPLIDLAAGFVREFSGWENIRLNAALLGLHASQIKRRLDAIVDFSGLERALDRPLKIYSNGMVLRLGFSIAAFSDPEILLVDEVLGVGDHNFYFKCLEKVRQLKQKGTSLILVSHDLNQINKICEEGLWLKEGTIRSMGRMPDVLNDYRSYLTTSSQELALA